MAGEQLLHARILLVDDEPVNLELLEDLLALEGYTNIAKVTDAREAVATHETFGSDLILLDLIMPHVSGFEVMETIRERAGSEVYLPILVLTADITRETKRRALASGATDFLTKPFDQTELILRVRNLLEIRCLYQHLQHQYQIVEQLHEQDVAMIRQRDETQSVISHDLGQPLSAIRVATRLLHRALTGESADRERVLEHLDLLDHAVGSMEAMTAELLDVSRLQRGKRLDLTLESCDLVSIVAKAVAAGRATAAGHSISFSHDIDTLPGDLDALRLGRVFSNLLANAIRYSPNGGAITVSLTHEVKNGVTWAKISVGDHGVGIPEADLPHIFEPFYRGSNVLDRIRGTGLGLAGARQIVELHGGAIGVESSPGQGSTFSVQLPVAWEE